MVGTAIVTQNTNVGATLPVSCKSPILPSPNSIELDPNIDANIKIMLNAELSRRRRLTAQRTVEKYLVERGTCGSLNPDIIEDFQTQILSFDDTTLQQIINSPAGLNSEIHGELACIVDAIISKRADFTSYSPLIRERIRNWFPYLRQIGGISVEGYAMQSSFSYQTNLFVFKTPKNIKTDDLLHETMVGLYALNNVRKIVPNFMYVYGYTRCSEPVIVNKEPITWCSSSEPSVSYMIVENIQNAIPMSDFISDPNISTNDFLAVMMQIINALNVAYKMYGFTHYDLHDNNIMVKKYDYLVAIPFYGTSEQIQGYIATIYVPYIIDYGFSCVDLGIAKFGKIGYEKYAINSKPFPMFDIYKLLGFMAQRIKDTQSSLLPVIDRLFSFFNEGPVLDRVALRLKTVNDYYRTSVNNRSITFDDYINWLVSASSLPLPIHGNLLSLLNKGVIEAQLNVPLDSCTFYEKIQTNSGPKSALEYCDLFDSFKTRDFDDRNLLITELNSKFSASEYFEQSVSAIYFALVDVDRVLRQDLPTLSENLLSDINFTDKYRKLLMELVKLKDMAAILISYIRSNLCAMSAQNVLQKYIPEIDNLRNEAYKLNMYIDRNKIIANNNLEISSTIEWKNYPTEISTFWTTEQRDLMKGL